MRSRARTHTGEDQSGAGSGCRCPRLTSRHRAPAGLSSDFVPSKERESAHLVPRGCHCAAAPAGPRPHARVQTQGRDVDSRHRKRGVDGATGIHRPYPNSVAQTHGRGVDRASGAHRLYPSVSPHPVHSVRIHIYMRSRAHTGGALPSVSVCIATPCPTLRMRAPSILTLHFASRSARPSMSALTMSAWPSYEAVQSGVHPSCRRDAEEERNTASHSAAAVLHYVALFFNTIMHGRLRRSFIRGPSPRRRGAASSRAAEAEWRVREQHHIARHSNARMGPVPRQ
jgi:hypothetical protein